MSGFPMQWFLCPEGGGLGVCLRYDTDKSSKFHKRRETVLGVDGSNNYLVLRHWYESVTVTDLGILLESQLHFLL